ncbi:MAG: nitroreductase family protein [Actinomycetia bacterium]|nr:nitroreductase family protein [Actinomycetes bacterium]
MDAILTRRSIRRYTDRPVADEVVVELLRAAMAAPSAQNQQPWQFIVVRDRSLLTKMAHVSRYSGMVGGAQAAVVVCGDLTNERSPGFWVEDCAAATQNLLIAAHALGLGAVWVGIYPRRERVDRLRDLFKPPEEVIPFAVIPIGYPAENPGPVDRFDRERVHFDRW